MDRQLFKQTLFTVVIVVIIQSFKSINIEVMKLFPPDLLHMCPIIENEWTSASQSEKSISPLPGINVMCSTVQSQAMTSSAHWYAVFHKTVSTVL